MFQSYIKVILLYLKLPYFILNLCIAEQLFTPHIIFHLFTDQAITNKTCLDGELALQDDWLCRELAPQGNVVQARAGLPSARQDLINCSLQSEILKFHVFAPSKMSTYCVMAPEECMMHNSQKICLVVFKRIKRIW